MRWTICIKKKNNKEAKEKQTHKHEKKGDKNVRLTKS